MMRATHYQHSFDDKLAKEFRKILSLDAAEEGPGFLPTDIPGLVLWLDASDTSKVILTYSTDGLSGVTASGVAGSHTVTTSGNVSAQLKAGARIRLGGAGLITTASTLGTNTYTIASITSTTITTVETLSQTYNVGTGLYRGLVSQLTDKSSTGANAAQSTASAMPLWISNGQNGLGTLKFDGADRLVTNTFTFTQPATQFLSFNASSVASGNNYIYDGISNNSNVLQIYGKLGIYNGSGSALWGGSGGYTISTGVNYLTSAVVNGASSSLFLNGGNQLTGNPGGGNPNGLTLGNYAGGGYGFDGYIYEYIGYSSALPTNARNLAEQYQAAKWGIIL